MKRSGFTLIEVLVVVAILAILAAIVVPNIMNRPDEAKRVAAQADIRAIVQSLKLYRLDNGFFFAGSHDVGRKPRSEKQVQRAYQDGLARARFPRQDVKAFAEFDLHFVDNCKMGYF